LGGVGWVAHEILVSAQGPLVLALGLWFGALVWGQGLAILEKGVMWSFCTISGKTSSMISIDIVKVRSIPSHYISICFQIQKTWAWFSFDLRKVLILAMS